MSKLHTEMRTELSKRFIASIKMLMEQKVIKKSSHKDGISFGELSLLLFGEDTSQSTITNILNGSRLANYAEAIILAREFGIDLTWLITGEGVITSEIPGPAL